MPHRPKLHRRWLLTVSRPDGTDYNIGAGVTTSGLVAIIGPPPGATCRLTDAQVHDFIAKVRAAYMAAAWLLR